MMFLRKCTSQTVFFIFFSQHGSLSFIVFAFPFKPDQPPFAPSRSGLFLSLISFLFFTSLLSSHINFYCSQTSNFQGLFQTFIFSLHHVHSHQHLIQDGFVYFLKFCGYHLFQFSDFHSLDHPMLPSYSMFLIFLLLRASLFSLI